MSVPPPPPPPQIKSTRPPPKQACDSSGPAFLADIRAGRTLRKVPDSEKKDRSAPLGSKPTDQNNEGSAAGPPALVSGNLPPVDLSNIFANGVPKLKSVSSADVARNNTVQNLSTKPSSYGNVKSPAPPPPPPLFPTTAASVAQNNYPLSATPYTLYQHSSPTANNNATAVRNGSSVPAPPAPPPPPTPARPSVSKSSSISSSNNNNNSYLRHSFHKKSSENNQPMPPIVQSPPVQVIMLSSIPTSSASPSSSPPPRVTPLQLGSIATVHENNINDMNSNSTVNNLNGTTTMPPPPSGRSPRRKQSSSNRYQRAGSTNADVNGIPVGQSTKVIRISSNINGSLPDPPSTPSSIVNPYLPSSVYDMNNYTANSRAHPTPPPPPPPPPPQQPSSLSPMNNYNDDNNNIASLVRRFESRFTFPDIGSVPVPKSYYGPKTYRVGSINSSVNNSNNLNDNYRNQVPYRVAPAAPRNY
uniref:WH2 domain-containing protein n=1 Tax=Schistosoma mansoni TaxID=6183 RepID=A0A5K4EZQ8_SCHMA